ncbi:hypothetical protein PIB30_001704 [Stylosanthes scabra]|uniref:Armadillo repeat-containing protein 7 n=1 Tax=Stylosanthes scabra TaxID=79078 RepID=A0ABU6U2Z3_9FABA|nr:hypothetical protein [Stylosanthes scabra]
MLEFFEIGEVNKISKCLFLDVMRIGRFYTGILKWLNLSRYQRRSTSKAPTTTVRGTVAIRVRARVQTSPCRRRSRNPRRSLSWPSSSSPSLTSRPTTTILSFSLSCLFPFNHRLRRHCRRTFSYLVGASVLVGRFNERTGKYGSPRFQYLQELVTQFQNTTDEVTRERILANLANFAYDPYNYNFLRQLNVLELFLDCMTEPNEKLVEFGVGGICNSCADQANVAVVSKFGGIPLIIQCLSSPVRNTVNYALGALYYICNESNKEEVLKPEVVDAIKRYAAAEEVSASFSNLAKAFLEKHLSEN